MRRFCPFAPFLGGPAVTDLTWRGAAPPVGGVLLLDVHGHHDEELRGGLPEVLATCLAHLTYTLPAQDLPVLLRRIPARPRGTVVLTGVRAPGD